MAPARYKFAFFRLVNLVTQNGERHRYVPYDSTHAYFWEEAYTYLCPRARYCLGYFVDLFVRLSITLAIHAQTVQYIEMHFIPYDRADARPFVYHNFS